jgi:phosphoserine aminotransferase
MHRVLNFSAGPAALPLPALERAQHDLLDYGGTGMSLMEQSHRGRVYESVHDEAAQLLRSLTGLPDTHDVLFLTGGASQHFAQIPLNFLPAGQSADYVVTGVWGEKAVAEARTVAALGGGTARLAADSGEGAGEARTWTRTPSLDELQVDPQAAYLHFTSNETIHGVQFDLTRETAHPESPAPLVCDMSSDFLWRPVDLSRYALVYAGAQKNLGPSGVVVVIARKEFLAQGRRDLPKIFEYRVHAANRSLYNTPPTLAIMLVRNVLAWVDDCGGLAQMERWNREKAALVYGAIDDSGGFYRCPVTPRARSVMNVVFRLPDEALEKRFVEDAAAQGMVGLAGHRSVGGIRASLYNAVPVDAARALAAFMAHFAARHG